MRPHKARLVIGLVVLLLPLAPIPGLQMNSNRTQAACVRLPWQPKDKCRTAKVKREFATNSAKKDIADALEAAYLEVINSFKSGRNAALKSRIPVGKSTDLSPYPDLRSLSRRYSNAVIALGGLVDTYPQSVQPTKLAWFSPVYKTIKQCYPNCEVDWIGSLYP